jgi:hypothetical protein
VRLVCDHHDVPPVRQDRVGVAALVGQELLDRRERTPSSSTLTTVLVTRDPTAGRPTRSSHGWGRRNVSETWRFSISIASTRAMTLLRGGSSSSPLVTGH